MTEPQQGVRQEAAHGVVSAARQLGRLLSFAALYPPGHRLVDGVVEELLAATRGLGDGIKLDVHEKRITAAGQDLPSRDQDIGRLHEILNSLAVSSLEIRPTASADDLKQFANVLLSHRTEVARSSGFSEIDVQPEMPTTILVKHRSYGSTLVPGESELEESLIERLGDLASAAYLDSVAKLVQTVVSRIVERIGHDASPGKGMPAPGRELETVLDLCAHAMRHAIEQMIDSDEELTEIEKLALRVEQAVALSADKDSVEVLLDVLQLAPGSDRKLVHRLDCDVDPTCEFSVEELQRRLDEATASATPLDTTEGRDLVEHLTILMHLAVRTETEELWQITAPVASLPSGALGLAEVRVLAAGAAEFVTRKDSDAVDRFLPAVVGAVRASPVDQLAHLFAPMCRGATDPAEASRVWPHVVAEILLCSESELPAEMYDLLRRVEDTQLESCIHRLSQLDVLRDCRVNLEWLESTTPELRLAVDHILTLPHGNRIGEQILAELRGRPPSWTGFEAVHLLDDYDDRARQIVRHVLRAGEQAATCRPLIEQSARIIADAIPRLPADRRDQPWLPAALTALGGLPEDDARRALSGVLRRRWWLRAEWPRACRLAARRALELCPEGPSPESSRRTQ